MKRYLLLTCLIISGIMLTAHTGFAQLKIRYVHSEKILAELPESQDVQKELDDLQKGWEQELVGIQQQLQEMQENYERQNLLLSDDRKKELQQEMQQLALKGNRFQEEKFGQQGEFARKSQELIAPLLERVQTAIDAVAERENCDMVFDTRSANIVYVKAKEAWDLSDAVIAELKKSSP